MIIKNRIRHPISWWVLLIATYTIVGSCVARSKSKKEDPIPSPTAATPPLTDNTSQDNLSDSTNSLYSETGSSSGFSSGSGASSASSGSFSSGFSSGYVSSGPVTPPTPTPTDFAGLPKLEVNNTCYMNAVLQIIAALYADEVKGTDLNELIEKINTGSKPLDQSDMGQFIDKLPEGAKKMVKLGQQEDPYQFIIQLLKGKAKFLSPIQCTESFFFTKDKSLHKITQERSANANSEDRNESRCLLTIPIPTDLSILSEIIQNDQNSYVKEGTEITAQYSKSTLVDKDPIPNCVQIYEACLQPCKQHAPSHNYITYKVFDPLPQKLCIHLARSDMTGKPSHSKIITLVDEAMKITIQPDPDQNGNKEAAVSFNLNGFIVHEGSSTDSGHYVAYVKRKEQWYEANDACIKKIDNTEACNKAKEAYLLFYTKQ